MNQKLFLSGPSQKGKSYHLRSLLPKIKVKIGGFQVKRVKDQNELIGFALLPPDFTLPEEIQKHQLKAEMFLIRTETGLEFKEEVFSKQFLAATEQGELLYLDEIGGIELKIESVRKRIFQLLKEPRPILGVWKSKENAWRLVEEGKVDPGFLPLHHSLEEKIDQRHLLLSFDKKKHWAERYLQILGLHRDLPGRKYCCQILQNLPENIKQHSLAVTKLVYPLALSLGLENPEYLIQAALLHDAKRLEPDHAKVMATELKDQYPFLASLIETHMVLPQEFYNQPHAVLWLADKSSLEDEYVHPQERFLVSKEKYGMTPMIKKNLKTLAAMNLPKNWQPKDLINTGGRDEKDFFGFTRCNFN